MPSLILTACVNEVGVRGWERNGLMDPIRGVALINSTVWGKRVRQENNTDVSVHSGKVPLRRQRQKRENVELSPT